MPIDLNKIMLTNSDDDMYQEIYDECFKERILMLNDDVDSESVDKIVKSILYYNKIDKKLLDSERTKKPITLIINSDGGDVYSGLMLSNIISCSETPVNTYCYSKAFSIAFIIFLSGTKRYLHENAMLMYHQISVEDIYGTLQALEEEVIYCKKLNNMINKVIKENSKITDNELKKYKSSKKDWFLFPEDNTKLMFADEIILNYSPNKFNI